jgi:hypothetical protein
VQKVLQEFSELVLLGVATKSLLSDKKVSLGQTRIMVQKGHNFLFDHWIAIKFLHEFLKVVFLGVENSYSVMMWSNRAKLE